MCLTTVIWKGSLVIFAVLIAIFLALSILMAVGMISKRLINRWQKKRSIRITGAIKESLNTLAALAVNSDEEIIEEVVQARSYLRQVAQSSPRVQQYIVDHLISLYKSLSGVSAQVLKDVYDDLGLFRVSKRKLLQGNYAKVIQGIQELSEMKRYEDVRSVIGFLDHYHPQVRLETRVALINLIPEDPLSYLKFMKDPLTRWEKILVFNKLQSLPLDQMPAFKSYFNHVNPEIVCFSINLAARFMQYDAVDAIIQLLFHKDKTISWQAVNALKLLQADQAAKHIQILLKQTQSLKVEMECIECLAQIGDMEELAPLFKKAINKTSNLEITKTLSKVLVDWHKKGANKLSKSRFSGVGRLMISHFSNPLIH